MSTVLRYSVKPVINKKDNSVRYVMYDNLKERIVFRGTNNVGFLSGDKAQRAFDYYTNKNSCYDTCDKKQHPFFDCLV